MKLRAVISPILVAAAAAGSFGPYDDPVGDGLEQVPQSIAPQSITVTSRYFNTVLPSGLGGPEDYFCRTTTQRQAINDAILAANPRPTGIYVMLDHENCNPYDSGVLIGSGTLARFPDVNTPLNTPSMSNRMCANDARQPRGGSYILRLRNARQAFT